MQTFLPYRNFEKSAQVLDYRRLGKQRVETYQVLKSLLQPDSEKKGWLNHPITKMWRGYELALLEYQKAICDEWVEGRGYKDTCWEKSKALFSKEDLKNFTKGNYPYPPWINDKELHRSHRSNLLRKDEGFYKNSFERGLSNKLEYVWPTQEHTA